MALFPEPVGSGGAMTKLVQFIAVFFAVVVGGMAVAFAGEPVPGCSDKSRCFQMVIQNRLPTASTFTIIPQSCYQGTPGSALLQPGQTWAIGLARVQGHGCDGKQGNFGIAVGDDRATAQYFSFSNDARLGSTVVSPKYYSGLSARSQTADGWYTYSWTVLGPWSNPPICNQARCFPLFIRNGLTVPVTWTLLPKNCYEGTLPAPFTVQPGASYQISLARVQGNGCDGNQGEFGLMPMGQFNNEVQNFNFSNSATIGLTNATYNFGSEIQAMPESNAYVWNVNRQSGASTPVAGCENQSRCFWLNLRNSMDTAATVRITGQECYEGTVGTYTINPLQVQRIGIARVQGRGCDGRQGNFSVSVNGDPATAYSFSNDAQLFAANRNTKYDMGLSSRTQTEDGWFTYDWTVYGPWRNPPLCSDKRCFQLVIQNGLEAAVTWKLNPGNCYQGTTPAPFTLEPRGRYQIALARVQGQGCDGRQGEFGLERVSNPGAPGREVQNFNFSNEGILGLTDLPVNNLAYLNRTALNESYTYTTGENVAHVPPRSASTLGVWSSPTTTLLDFTTNNFWPNFYQACFGYEVYHPQHVIRLPNDARGNAYFMVSQSREHNGYLTLLKVDSSKVSKTTDAILSEAGAVAGSAVWQEVYTGEFNGSINPTGNWNHPGKMSLIDGVLAVAAQNWHLDEGRMFACGYRYITAGTSEDKVLFYDVRDVTSPRYIGGMTAGQLGAKNRELATVELAYDPAANKYLLVAGGDKVYPVLSADILNPSFNAWSPVPRGVTFSGQHGLAFDATVDGANRLWYFDASRSKGQFSFVGFAYLPAAPYLAPDRIHTVPLQLPGADRDWDSSSLYVTATEPASPIIYTVKSLYGDNYQLYQVVPPN